MKAWFGAARSLLLVTRNCPELSATQGVFNEVCTLSANEGSRNQSIKVRRLASYSRLIFDKFNLDLIKFLALFTAYLWQTKQGFSKVKLY